ncbi:MAG: hypothetical protein OFPII_11160 [Osedax symbiont Rs1]|nr:MAG: hypothetical protein OFPII_11160 [Osedax symbiont Rs1]
MISFTHGVYLSLITLILEAVYAPPSKKMIGITLNSKRILYSKIIQS